MRRKRLKKYVLILLTVSIIALAGAGHILSIVVPIKFQTVLLEELERAMGKKILIRSVSFNVFKGLSLDGVVIYDKYQVLVRAKSISAYIVFPELFNRRLVVPFIKVEGPQITLERSLDGAFNLECFFPKNYSPPEDLSLVLRRIVVRRGSIVFIDRKIDPFSRRNFTNFNADIKLRLPDRIEYNSSFYLQGKPVSQAAVKGEYMIREKRFKADLDLQNIAPSTLAPYMGAAELNLPGGLMDIGIALDLVPSGNTMNVKARIKDVVFAAGTVRTTVAGTAKADLFYDHAVGKWKYGGEADISSMTIEGIEGLGVVDRAKGVFKFDDTRLWSDDVRSSMFGIPWKLRVNLVNFSSPILDVYADFEGKLGALQKNFCESCNMKVPVELAGDCRINLSLTLEKDKPLKMNGYAALQDVTMRLGSGLYPIEHISGEVRFRPDRLEWSDLKLSYHDMPLNVSGTIKDFSSPAVEFKAFGDEVSFDVALNLSGGSVGLTRFSGKYIDSYFSMAGSLDIKDPAGVMADVKGSLNMDLKDLRYALNNYPGIRKVKPSGRLKAEFTMAGNTRKFFDCAFHAKAKAKSIALYGARLSEASIDYSQSDGVGEVKTFHARCYGGLVSSNGKINWRAKAQPYSFSLKAQDIMLELLREDTGFKDADVSGDLKVYSSINGYFKDVTRLSGVGRISITDGRLWQLNLFKGIGRSIFTSDFSSIVFSEGSCDFKIRDQVFFADSIDLKGELMRLSGAGMIGFDKTIEGILRPEINEEAMWPGTQRNIAMAVQRGTAIEITGTLKDPRFRTTTDFFTVVGGVAGALLSSE